MNANNAFLCRIESAPSNSRPNGRYSNCAKSSRITFTFIAARSNSAGSYLLILSCLVLLCCVLGCASAASGSHGQPGKQQSLRQWQRITEHKGAPPRVFVDHNQIRFYFFPQTNEVVQFSAKIGKQRWPYDEYEVNS